MEQQLKDLRAAAMGATPEALLQKIEEETKVNTYIVMQKLPKEIDAKRKMVENLQKVIDQPALGIVTRSLHNVHTSKYGLIY